MYPQPTDDELAAQQPYTAALGSQVNTLSRPPGSPLTAHSGAFSAAPGTEAGQDGTSPAEANRPLLGKVALVITIIAAGLSLLASIIFGVTIGPLENEHGYFFTDTPGWFQNLVIALAGLQVLCAALGVTGLIMGIVSAVSDRARTQGIVAIAIALLAPSISFALFMILSFTIA